MSVHPIYGWGWVDSRMPGATAETPSDFEVAAERESTGLRGKVVSPGHPYSGAEVLMSPRHTVWDGLVNVEIVGNDPDTFTATGYGQIPVESLSL